MSFPGSELDELISNKSTEIEKLNDEYKLLKKRNCISDSEIKTLNTELFNLMAEVKVLKESEPEIMPKSDSLLYAWTQNFLEESIKEKERTLCNLEKIVEESANKRKSLMQRSNNVEEVNKKLLEDAQSKNELLHCFHGKMVRRLRRLSRRFPRLLEQSDKVSKSTRDVSGNVLTRSFYRVLKEFVVELQDRTFQSDNWMESQRVIIDETYCKDHINILCDTNIIERSTENPSSYHLVHSLTKSKSISNGEIA